jgi:hypothetical protein
METNQQVKLQAGAWHNIKAYPEKIKFDVDKTVVVKFSSDFTEPLEMPNKTGDGVFYIFDVFSDDKLKSITTSSPVLIRNLSSHMPLANKVLGITKKLVAGKNIFYVEVISDGDTEELVQEEEIED